MSRPLGGRSFRLRALVLTAGLGTRLAPLTAHLPKPLVPVAGTAVSGHTLRQLAAHHCELAVLNTHHLADRLPAHFGRTFWGLPLVFSYEEEILGTLGALYPSRDVLAECDAVVLVNGDALCRWPLRKILRRHKKSGADATLLLHRRSPSAELGGGVALDRDGRIVQLRDAPAVGEVASRHLFMGLHVLSPRLLSRVEAGFGDIVDGLYQPLLTEDANLRGVVTAVPWFDLGSPTRYLRAAQAWSRDWRGRSRSSVSPLARVEPSAALEGSAIEADAYLGAESKVSGSILLANSRVGEGSVLRDTIVGPGVHLPPRTNLEKRMVNRLPTAYEPRQDETVLGTLVYTPLGS